VRDWREIVKIAFNYLAPLAVLLWLAVVGRWHPILALLPAVLAFGGLYLMLNNPATPDSAEQLRADARAKVEEARAHIERIRAVAQRVTAEPAKGRLLHICQQADQIIGSGKELSLHQATRLAYAFQQATRIIDPYAIVIERKDDRHIWTRMKHEVEHGDIFRSLDESIGDLATQLDRSDAFEVDAAIAALKGLAGEGI
jgi:TRAP-type uncharacterized transport system fused permease subunit